MAWLEITVNTAPDTVEQVSAALTAGGFADLLIEDQTQIESFLEENRAYWDYIDEELQQQLQGLSRIKLYLEDTDTQGLQRLKSLLDGLGLGFEKKLLLDTDWETSWQDSYPPQEIGKKLTILPVWLADTDIGDRLPVILDPGLTFGTGSHPTTRMVIGAMEETIKAGAACLDLGSGSGILSIAALRLGAGLAMGVDIDPKAEDIARENAGYNGFTAPQFTALTGNVLGDKALMQKLKKQTWDVVLVNIVADVIIALALVLPEFLSKNSKLICSGILDTRLSDVVDALTRAGLVIKKTHAEEEWRCLELIRKDG